MKQLPLFDMPQCYAHYETNVGHARGWRTQIVTIIDENGDPVVTVDAETHKKHPTKRELIDRAWLAYLQRNRRPHGDEYEAPEGRVYYWYEQDST